MTKLLFHSNSPWAPTGYGAQTALFAPRLKEHYDLAISAFYGLDGARLEWQGIPVYPGMGVTYGNETILDHVNSFFEKDLKGGLVFTLMDVWVLNPDLWGKFNLASWCPVDHDPLPPAVHQFLSKSGSIPIAMSRFGEEQLAHFDPLYVPHAVDTKILRPIEKREARKTMGLPKDPFLVGVVAANKGGGGRQSDISRKSFPEILQAFAVLRQRHPEALLYLHTEVTGRNDGVNLPILIRSLDIDPEAIVFADQYRIQHHPLPPEAMANVFSSFDVLLAPSRGEGFGVPIIEAQACGVPVIVSDFSAMAEVCGAGWRVEVEPEWSGQLSWQVRPKLESVVQALEEAYTMPRAQRTYTAEKARKHALNYDIDKVMEDHMLPALEEVQERIGEAPNLKVAA